jgi:epoxyqueuosine reductase QueG
VINAYVTDSINNVMPGYPGERIWDEPLVGFAGGDDDIFQQYKTIIGPFHQTPREALEAHLKKVTNGYPRPESVTVISFILPSSRATRESMRKESQVCSLRWNYTRHYGQEFLNRLQRHVVVALESLGHHAIAPDLEKSFAVQREGAGVRRSNWSQRHIAFAAGLGTFGLSDGFISSKGMAIRVGSVVTDLAVPPTPRPYRHHMDNCLSHRDGSCGKCIERCPAGAITREGGHDKVKCSEYLVRGMPKVAQELGRNDPFIGGYMGCGFCQTKVPCEGGIPRSGA